MNVQDTGIPNGRQKYRLFTYLPIESQIIINKKQA